MGIDFWLWAWNLSAKDTQIASYYESVNDVTVSGNIVFVAIGKLGIAAVDVSNPLQPKSLGEYGVGGDAVCIQVERNLAYVGLRDNGIRIIDVSKPYAPSLKGGITNGVRSVKLQIDGKLAYVCTDVARHIFKHIDENGEIVKDVRASKLTKKLTADVKKMSSQIVIKKAKEEEEAKVNCSFFLTKKMEEIAAIDQDNSKFRMELANLTVEK